MGGACGLNPEIRATSVPIDAPVPRSGPTPVTLGTNAEGRPPNHPLTCWWRGSPSWAKKGQGSQGTESPGWSAPPKPERCRLCLIACNSRHIDEVRPSSGSERRRLLRVVRSFPGVHGDRQVGG
jgi:hypothetical protein